MANGFFNRSKLEFKTHSGQRLTFPYSPGGNLPLMLLDWDVPQAPITSELQANLNDKNVLDEVHTILSDHNHNLSNPQKELMLWHYRLGHAGCSWVRDLMRKEKGPEGSISEGPFIPTRFPTTKSVNHPKYASCLMAKQLRRGTKSQVVCDKPEHEMAICRNATAPGSEVSTDQWISKLPGRLPHTFGKEQMENRYNGGRFFFDHYSGFIWINCQVSLQVGETLEGKRDFEHFADQHGVKLKRFRADNQPFDSAEWRADLELNDQTMTFSRRWSSSSKWYS